MSSSCHSTSKHRHVARASLEYCEPFETALSRHKVASECDSVRRLMRRGSHIECPVPGLVMAGPRYEIGTTRLFGCMITTLGTKVYPPTSIMSWENVLFRAECMRRRAANSRCEKEGKATLGRRYPFHGFRLLRRRRIAKCDGICGGSGRLHCGAWRRNVFEGRCRSSCRPFFRSLIARASISLNNYFPRYQHQT